MPALRLYEPINQMKPVAPDLWIVDGPEVRMRYAGMRLPFPTRMTVVKLPDGRLWMHSPTEPSDDLCQAVEDLGPVAFIVSPNRLHTSWLAAWKQRRPEAQTAGVAAEPAWNGQRLAYDLDLGAPGPFPWSGLEHRLVVGGMFSEAIFFHAASRTLILTDLVENFELQRVDNFWLRLILRITGPLDPNGTSPPDMRYTFRKHMPGLRAAVQWIRDRNPERVILSHGRWYERDGLKEMERAFAWVR